MGHPTKETRTWNLVRRQLLIVGLLAACAILLMNIFGNGFGHVPVSSAEVKFTDATTHGMEIVPASCPSTPDFPGQCNPVCTPSGAVSCSGNSIVNSCGTVVGACSAGQSCVNGGCQNNVCTPSGVLSCSGNNIVNSCGSVVGACLSGQSCVNGACQGGSCTPSGVLSCSGNNIINSCGTVVAACTSGQTCVGGACRASCTPSGVLSCSGNNIINSCGAVVSACSSGQICSGGSCISSCTPTNACGTGAQINDVVNSCTGSIITNCVATYGAGWTCGGGVCIAPPPPVDTIIAIPAVVKQGLTSQISWSAKNVQSCTVSGSNGDGTGWSCTGSACAATTTKTSSAINNQVVYTLACLDLDNSTSSKKAVVNILPKFCENGATNCD